MLGCHVKDTGVTTFYDQTQAAFDLLWMNSDNLAMHYG